MIIISKATQKQTIAAIKTVIFPKLIKLKNRQKRTLEKCSMPFLLVLSH